MKEKEERIRKEVDYCLNCVTKPCSKKGCPLGNDIPRMIQLVKQQNFKEAYEVLSETTVLPGVCGAICPHSRQCQGSCVRGIKEEAVKIGEIERYVFEKAIENNYRLKDIWKIEQKGYKGQEKALIKKENNSQDKEIVEKENNKHLNVAVIGGGPAGLTCSAFLAKNGVKVTIYERYEELGGILTHGIPDFRLDREIIKETIERILELGIEVKTNCELGKDISLGELEKEYDAIFLSIGANKSVKSNVEGESLKGVYGGNELLEKSNHPDYHGKKVAVIGGGNVAIDCCRTIKRLRSKRSVCNI